MNALGLMSIFRTPSCCLGHQHGLLGNMDIVCFPLALIADMEHGCIPSARAVADLDHQPDPVLRVKRALQ